MSESRGFPFQFGILTLFGVSLVVAVMCFVARLSSWATAPTMTAGIFAWVLVAAAAPKNLRRNRHQGRRHTFCTPCASIDYNGGMQFTLGRLTLAIPWFGLAAFVLARHLHIVELARAAAVEGRFLCGMGALGVEPCLPAVVAGIATLFGQRWIVAIVGIPTAAWVALWILGSTLP